MRVFGGKGRGPFGWKHPRAQTLFVEEGIEEEGEGDWNRRRALIHI